MMRPLSKEETAKSFNELMPKYNRLALGAQKDLQSLLEGASVDVLDVDFRLKKFDSFWDKIERKGYTDPFSEIEDVCGIRIICFYPSDLDRISEIINTEFVVNQSMDKADLLEPDRFGYRSLHYIVTLKKDWLNAPQYRGLENLKVEIQVRTILMHAWAGLSHKLAYKKKEDVPDQFKRKLYQLSALFEIADEQFDSLQQEKFGFQQQLFERSSQQKRFDVSQSLNVDTLQAFLDFYFPEQFKVDFASSGILDDLKQLGVSFETLVNSYEQTKDFLPIVEKRYFPDYEHEVSQNGLVRMILILTSDTYATFFQERFPHEADSIKRIREDFKNREIR